MSAKHDLILECKQKAIKCAKNNDIEAAFNWAALARIFSRMGDRNIDLDKDDYNFFIDDEDRV